jgi:nicotinamide-nucleotide amidase
MGVEADVARLLYKHRKTIAVAESCTGGLVSHLLTNIPGSSKYFKLGIVAYSTQAKISLLNISRQLITRYSTVSSETALSMAKSIRKIAKADIGLSTTGIAGPGGESKCKQPVGSIYIGLAHQKGTFFKQFRFRGVRKTIKLKASIASLKMVKEWLIQLEHSLP